MRTPKRVSGQQPAKPRPLASLLAPLAALHEKKGRGARPQAGIQSLETGLEMLKTLVAAAAPMKLKHLAASGRMSPSKAHRYLVSLARSGLVAQDAQSGEYRLGPYAVEMSVACLSAIRPIRLASEALEAIGREIGLTVAIAAWGNHGATIVRIEESLHAVTMNVRPGTVVPLSRSASGLVFAAFMPRHVVEPLLAAEAPRQAQRDELESQLDEVRRVGVAAVAQTLVPGADALAVPVFDHRGAIALAIMAVGSTGTFSLKPDGPVAQVMKRHAGALSRELGYRI